MPPKRKAIQLTLIEQSEPVPRNLQVHLAKDCLNVDDEIRRIFVRNILRLCGDDDDIINDESNKHQKLNQLNITDFWDNEYNEALSKSRQDLMD
ncbi:hypothetical protein RclHR1_32020001 [Rhizophagus clarus]|uniref:Uncharacterized protein n=1 Tax=Rhizophagus clarus TaxID=94130 RepID=A0A2Z6RBJ9_9GLOM|nr:hypothetical protein RclHR1_32020001 [Rhizophagus clarus]